MKYYSEKTNTLYNNVELLQDAEKQFDEKHALELKKKEERATRAKEVEDAWAHYVELVKQFVKDFGSYHKTYKDDGFIDFINDLWHFPF